MLKIAKYIITSLFLLLLFNEVYASYLKTSLNKREVEINKTLLLTVEISDDIENFDLPKIPDFVIMQKDSYKKSGKRIYIYEVIPKSVGFFVIPSFVVNMSDKDISSRPINVKVFEQKTSKKKSIESRDSSTEVEAYTDISAVYVNQLITYTLSFKTRQDLSSNPNYILPMFKDFWKSKSKSKSGYKLINGENYFIFDVKTPLYPMREGNISIEPSNVSIEYLNSGRKISLRTKTVNIKVFPLPEMGKPDNFTGAVGKYYISSSVNKKSVKINEPLILTINIKGNGNINAVSEPKINLSDDMKKYATSVKIKSDEFMGLKRFQCVIIPLIEGDKIIPEIYFSYFDPDLKDYVNIKTKKIKIEVAKGVYKTKDSDAVIENMKNEINSQQAEDDIYPIKNDIDIKIYKHNLIKNKKLILLVLPFILIPIFLLIYRMRLIFLENDVLKMQKISSHKKFVRYLKETYKSLQNDDQFKFYFYIDISVRMLLQSKTNCDYINMIKEEIKENLLSFNVGNELIEKICNMLSDCEKFKFTSAKADKTEMENAYNVLKYIIKDELDKIL